MSAPSTRLILAALVCSAACGTPREAAPDGRPRPDAGLPADAPVPDAAVPDASVDSDRDGHPANTDCNDDDASVWQNLAYAFRDADGDQHTVAMSGAICSGAGLPPGYSLFPGAPDCNDADPAAFTTVTGFVDVDGDGFGVGPQMTFCNAGTLPPGFAALDGDCEAEDPARWVGLPYSFRDADGDGAAVAQTGVVCSGEGLPPGYFTLPPAGRPLDCDDANPAVSISLTVFADVDHDGFGAGSSQLACTNGSPPPGFATVGTDCDDNDMAIWVSLVYVAVDRDADTVTAPELGTRCTAGTLLPPFFATPNGNDCDDSNAAISVALTVFADDDLDGFGAGPGQLVCTNGSPPAGSSTNGTDCDDDDATIWALLTYVAVDSDGDGVTVPESGQLCTAGTLPPPFRATANGNDCDDDDPTVTHLAVLYPDRDGDGVGAPPRQITCIGSALPAGLVRRGYDENDADPQVIETEDFDDLLELLLLD
jgi:hypothetical protein